MFTLQFASIKPSDYQWFSSQPKLEGSLAVTYLRR